MLSMVNIIVVVLITSLSVAKQSNRNTFLLNGFAHWHNISKSYKRYNHEAYIGLSTEYLMCVDTGTDCTWQMVMWFPLELRHNERDDVWNHRGLRCLLHCWFRRRSKTTSKLRATGLCVGNYSPHKKPVTRIMFPFDDVIMIKILLNYYWAHCSLITLFYDISGSTIDQVMGCCLTTPSYYLNQFWLIISEVLWYLPEGKTTGNAQDIYLWYKFAQFLI